MRRRDFITLLGAATAWPLAVRAQQGDRVRRIGVLLQFTEADYLSQGDLPAFREALAKLGWVEDRNLQIDVRFGGADAERIQILAAELVKLAPDVIVAGGGAATRTAQHQTQVIPIVITAAGDPTANGILKNIAHPEGNVTGITNLYASMGGKWLELLKQAFPMIETVGLVHNPQLNSTQGSPYFPSIEEAARGTGISGRTLRGWLAEESFAREYRTARRKIVEHSIGLMQNASVSAVLALLKNLQCGKPGCEIAAANSLLEKSLAAVQQFDLESRLALLEERAAQQEAIYGFHNGQANGTPRSNGR